MIKYNFTTFGAKVSLGIGWGYLQRLCSNLSNVGVYVNFTYQICQLPAWYVGDDICQWLLNFNCIYLPGIFTYQWQIYKWVPVANVVEFCKICTFSEELIVAKAQLLTPDSFPCDGLPICPEHFQMNENIFSNILWRSSLCDRKLESEIPSYNQMKWISPTGIYLTATNCYIWSPTSSRTNMRYTVGCGKTFESLPDSRKWQLGIRGVRKFIW